MLADPAGSILKDVVEKRTPPPAGSWLVEGIDGFIGDGNLRQAAEGILDVFYSASLWGPVWLSADYQLLWNPGYNANRAGPVNIPGARIHAEF